MKLSIAPLFLISSTLLALCNIVKSQQLRRKLQDETDIDLSKLRYVTLGASATWGASLPDPKTGYPYQLSPNVTNLAIRASGPNYPSICIQTMIGDGEYDVIILEYLMACRQGLDTLATRLRQRFPDAIIIFNMIWIPVIITGKDNNGRDTSFFDIWQKHNYKTGPMSPEHIATITSEMASFYLNPPYMKGIIEIQQELRSPNWRNKERVPDKLSPYNDP